MGKSSTSLVLVSVAVCAVMAGCASTTPGGIQLAGSPPSCAPEVQVNVTGTVSGGTASVLVNPQPAAPYDSAGGGIRWKLRGAQGQALNFTSDGIAFAAPPTGAGPVASGSSSEFVWCFGSSTAGSPWKYTVKFFEPGAPSKVWACDPTVVSSDTFKYLVAGPQTYPCR